MIERKFDTFDTYVVKTYPPRSFWLYGYFYKGKIIILSFQFISFSFFPKGYVK